MVAVFKADTNRRLVRAPFRNPNGTPWVQMPIFASSADFRYGCPRLSICPGSNLT
jgi:hypothetical protein